MQYPVSSYAFVLAFKRHFSAEHFQEIEISRGKEVTSTMSLGGLMQATQKYSRTIHAFLIFTTEGIGRNVISIKTQQRSVRVKVNF